MDEQIRFTCKRCGEEHSGVPSFGFGFPIQLMDVPEAEREERVFLTEDTCVIDDKHFFVLVPSRLGSLVRGGLLRGSAIVRVGAPGALAGHG